VLRHAAAAILVGALALPGSAVAHDTYVDRSDGTGGANDCTDKSDPCFSLTTGIANAGHRDTVFVGGDPAVYESPHTLDDRKSLVHKDFSKKASVDTSGDAVLDPGSNASPALSISGRAGTVKGFTIRSETLPVAINGSVTISHDRFDEDQQIPEEIAIGGAMVAFPRIVHSTFIDPTPLTGGGSEQSGIYYEPGTGGGPEIVDNKFKDLQVAIRALGAGPVEITRNDISGTHSANGLGEGIRADGPVRTEIEGNVLHDADISAGTVDGIEVLSNSDLSRNRVSDYQTGVYVSNVAERTDFESDAYMNNAFSGVQVSESSSDPKTDAELTNETFWNPTASQGELELVDVQVDVNSTIIGPTGIDDFLTTSTCDVKFSRGPSKQSGGDGCKDFKTKRNPRLKSDHYHLKPGSPMIDAGDPSDFHLRAIDIDGNPRWLDGHCHGRGRRDIGADEFKC
jgi:hypothetical protein